MFPSLCSDCRQTEETSLTSKVLSRRIKRNTQRRREQTVKDLFLFMSLNHSERTKTHQTTHKASCHILSLTFVSCLYCPAFRGHVVTFDFFITGVNHACFGQIKSGFFLCGSRIGACPSMPVAPPPPNTPSLFNPHLHVTFVVAMETILKPQRLCESGWTGEHHWGGAVYL